jgi:hypothetical protein
VDIRCQLHVLQQISLSKRERSYFILLLPNQGNDSIDFTWPSHLQMDRSSLPAEKFGRFKPFFIWFPWQIIQVIFSQNFITVPGTVVLIPQLWCHSDPETAKMLALATKSSQVNSVCSGGLLSVFFLSLS